MYTTESLLALMRSTRLQSDSTWAGQNLIRVIHELQGNRPLELQDKRHEVTLRANPCIERGRLVMIQEDQAEEPWSSYVGLYTVAEGFKAPP